MRPLFVCGPPKSGTTWLQRVLDAHPEIVCSGEGHFVDKFVRPLAQVMKDYNRQMKLVGERVYEGKPYYPGITQSYFDEFARKFVMDRLSLRATGPGTKWIGDKTPRYTLNLDLLARLLPEARFVAIVRDPRDAAMSRLFHAHRANHKGALDAGSEEQIKVTRFGAEDWVRNVEAIGKFAAAHPGRLHRLRYEDLSANPQNEMARLFGFLDVAADPSVVAKIAEATSFEAQSGRKAGDEDKNSHLRRGIVGDWVGRLDANALAIVEEVCGPLMRANGYA